MLSSNPFNGEQQTDAATASSEAGGHERASTSKALHAPALPRRGLLRRRWLWVVGGLLALVAIGLAAASPHLRAWYHLRVARAELQHYHTAQAQRHLQVCRETWPDSPEVLLLAARAERRALHYSEAQDLLDRYQRARGLDDAFSSEQLLLSAERNVDRVADQCWRYIAQDRPDTPLLLEALTRGYFRKYNLPAVRACLDRWLEIEPENPQAHYLDGQYRLTYAHKQSAAAASFRRALELDPDHDEARICLAVALLDSHGDPDVAEAAIQFEFVRQRQPDNLSVQVGLAECRKSLGQLDEAVKLVDQVLSKQPDYAPALALRGRLALDQGQFAEAETWLRQAFHGDPNNYVTRRQLFLCLLRNGKEEEARKLEQESKQIEDDLRRYDEIVTRDLPSNSHDPALLCELGELLLRLGRQEEGLRWLESALKEDKNYAPARKALEELQKKDRSKE
jgi:tetratricopeptide (TPR) repeat protein